MDGKLNIYQFEAPGFKRGIKWGITAAGAVIGFNIVTSVAKIGLEKITEVLEEKTKELEQAKWRAAAEQRKESEDVSK